MRLVLSGSIRFINTLRYFGYKDMLGSYHYPEQLETITNYAKDGRITRLIIDSGAFSAWNSGEEINIYDYIKFLHQFKKERGSLFNELYFVNLDVIPGQKGERVTYDQVLEAAEKGLEHFEIMLNEGFTNTIHVFHQGEPISILQRILSYGTDYIGISPSNDATTKQRESWLDEAFKYVPKDVRTHGFAVTSPYLMTHYPWFSVDSISWFMHAVYGTLLVGIDSSGHIVTDDSTPVVNFFKLYLSPRKLTSPGSYIYFEQNKPGLIQHVDEYIRFICKLLPITPSDLFADQPVGRVVANLWAFIRLVESKDKQYSLVVSSLF